VNVLDVTYVPVLNIAYCTYDHVNLAKYVHPVHIANSIAGQLRKQRQDLQNVLERKGDESTLAI
jgi:hypothetical protein